MPSIHALLNLQRTLFLLIVVTAFCSTASSSIHRELTNEKDPYFAHGKCKGLWRPDKLLGRCFGLDEHSTDKFPELKHIKTVESAQDCRALCCNLKDKCVSWQYQSISKKCTLGPPVRLGLEGAGTVFWCEPLAPSAWNGKKITTRDSAGAGCVWGDSLPGQCFGLGPERLSTANKRLSTTECAAACCASSECDMWQEAPGRGCYFNKAAGVWCEEDKKIVYDGGRKCIPNFCGGMEDSILAAYNRTQAALK